MVKALFDFLWLWCIWQWIYCGRASLLLPLTGWDGGRAEGEGLRQCSHTKGSVSANPPPSSLNFTIGHGGVNSRAGYTRSCLEREEMGTDCRGTITLNELSTDHTCAWDPVLAIQPWLALQRLPGGKVSISVMTLDFVHSVRSFWAWNNFMCAGGSLLANSSQHHLLTLAAALSFFQCYSQLSFCRIVELEYKMQRALEAARSAALLRQQYPNTCTDIILFCSRGCSKPCPCSPDLHMHSRKGGDCGSPIGATPSSINNSDWLPWSNYAHLTCRLKALLSIRFCHKMHFVHRAGEFEPAVRRQGILDKAPYGCWILLRVMELQSSIWARPQFLRPSVVLQQGKQPQPCCALCWWQFCCVCVPWAAVLLQALQPHTVLGICCTSSWAAQLCVQPSHLITISGDLTALGIRRCHVLGGSCNRICFKPVSTGLASLSAC